MFSNVFLTDVVPAPDEPVIEMMGCRRDMDRTSPKQAAAREQGRVAALEQGLHALVNDVDIVHGAR